jgi:chorismate mutase
MTEHPHANQSRGPGAESTAPSDFDARATSLNDVDPSVFEELLSIRQTIDNIDAALVHMLAERFRATQRVGYLKAQHDLPPGDAGREAAQIQRLRGLAESAHLDPEFAEKILNFIISEVIRHHERIAEDHRTEAPENGA